MAIQTDRFKVQTPSSGSWDGKWLYGKSGLYNQLDAELSTGHDDMSQAKMYKLEIA